MQALLIACRLQLECQDTYVAAGSADSACSWSPLAQARHLSYRVQKDVTGDSSIGLAASLVCPSGLKVLTSHCNSLLGIHSGWCFLPQASLFMVVAQMCSFKTRGLAHHSWILSHLSVRQWQQDTVDAAH